MSAAHDVARESTETVVPSTSEVQIFVSFDTEHDATLYELFLEQSRTRGSGFSVLAGSETRMATDVWSERARQRIGEADQVIVLCGEHTDESVGVFAELRIAQEDKKPYFLLWGRREIMCTKPAGAKSSDGMYSWTESILQDQIAVTLRTAEKLAAVAIRNAAGKA